MQLRITDREDGDEHPSGARSPQSSRSFTAGAPGGEHVVHDQADLAGEADSATGAESAAHVFAPSGRSLSGLPRRVANASEPTHAAGDAEAGGHGGGEHFTLVVAAAPTPPPVQGHGKDEVDPFRLKARFQQLGPELTETFGQRFTGGVLHPQDDVSQHPGVRSHAKRSRELQAFVTAARAAIVNEAVGTDRRRTAGTNGIRVFG